MGRYRPALILLASLAALPAAAQTRTVVVPAGQAVVIGPRGQALPRPSMAPPTRAQQRLIATAPEADTLTAPGVAAVLGLAGAAALAVMLGGGGGSAGGGAPAAAAAPVRTR